MIAALLRKELQEHWIALLVVGVVSYALFSLMLTMGVVNGSPPFGVFRHYVLFVLPLAAWVLGGRLIRREYGGRTQLFLDALPVSRNAVLAMKYAVGGAALALYALPALGISAVVASRSQDVFFDLFTIVALRTVAFAWLLHAGCFLLGFVGRYRVAVLIVALVSWAYVEGTTEFELWEVGPLALLDHTFPSERHDVPWLLLGQTSGAAVVVSLLAFGVAALREGSVAARLAQQMSQRERAFVGVVLVAAFAALATYDEKREKAPFAPEVAARVETPGLSVTVGAGSRMTTAEAQALAEAVHARMDAMRAHLSIDGLTPLFLFSRYGLDAGRYERGHIDEGHGVAVRVNHPSPGWNEDHFIEWLVRHTVADHTRRRALQEPRCWVVDGFGPYWAQRDCDGDSSLDGEHPLLLRALYGAPEGLTSETLDRWFDFREQVGGTIARAVAWSGLATLERRHGAEKARAVHAALLGVEPPEDFRALWHPGNRSVEDVIEEHTGATYEAFVRAWNEELQAARARSAATLATLPRVSAELEVLAVSDGSREVSYTASLVPAADPDSRVRFQWNTFGPFRQPFDEDNAMSDDVALATARGGRRAPHTFRRGALVGWRIAHRVEALDCDVVSRVVRTVLK